MSFRTKSLLALLLAGGAGAAALVSAAPRHDPAQARGAKSSAQCDTAGLSLPPGFCATVFADDLGHARHMAVAADGTVYVNTWSGRYYRGGDAPPAGGFLVALRDADGDGRAETVRRFGPTQAEGSAGGTGIALYSGGLYAEMNDKIVRYPLTAGQLVPTTASVTVLSGMPLTGDHPMHPFAIDRTGGMFVNSGSPSNACQHENRQAGSPGKAPCEELATRAGIWRYDAAKTDQRFTPAGRFASGIRNAGGISFDTAGHMYAVQHGRDQLSQNWPALYRAEQGPVLPSEELMAPAQGDDFGWPACYYDGDQGKLVLAPEYGGDGGKAVGVCAGKKPPVAAFPAHWAPNDVMAYGGGSFPAAYRSGVFIAFHGSWNRAPAPQDGYKVVFQPLADGRPSGRYIVFADGFAGAFKEPGRAAARPAGLAMAPDGALYIADDVHGRIWRVTYRGDANAALVAAKSGAASAPDDQSATEIATSALHAPPGFTTAQVALGARIYAGEVHDGTCTGCHGSDARGSSVGPTLIKSQWLWADGSPASLAHVIASGVAKPKQYGGAMPPRGGAPLTDDDVNALAAYLWALNHRS
jgi:glucose/arabinose dehydrogenase